jgi:putative endonuclease
LWARCWPRGIDLARDTKRLGAAGERAAARCLRRSGYRILARNLVVKVGEADLVALAPDRQTIVIVEVKTRLAIEPPPGAAPIPPEANITAEKRAKLLSVARELIRRNGWHDRQVRIDVVAIEWPRGRGRPTIRHHAGAVSAG